ncbi:MAG: hypothetical protein AB1512_19810 [Thermodesulfobacteriota bacterium]
MGIDISLEQLAALYQLGSLGKLINGLIHNLNGPLQNLSMDLEMMAHSVRTAKGLPGDLAEPMMQRLQRMEREFDHINGLIRAASARANAQGSGEHGLLRAFLEQEISFLNANLYFKHNVQTRLLLDQDLPPLVHFPEGVGLSLSWFLQSLVEDMERERVTRFTLKARSGPSGLEISFIAEGGTFSPAFLEGLAAGIPFTHSVPGRSPDIGGAIAVALLKQNGAAFACRSEESAHTVQVTLPLATGNPLF